MAKKLKRVTTEETPAAPVRQAEACPTFTLRAGRAGHVRALRAAIKELAPPDSIEARVALEAFKEFEKAR
jgi:hypothetical protein